MWWHLVNLFLFLPYIESAFIEVSYRDVPPAIDLIMSKISASEIMTDITNDMSYRVLQQHSVGNRNNFAFSPTSLMSVLIALYEGSQGGCATQIYNVLKLPWNRDLLRIGYRDVHRRLRKYFLHEENPLTGLSLSKENVTITTQYEDILRFYGYDLGSDMRPFDEGNPNLQGGASSTTEKATKSSTTTQSTQSTTSESTTLSPMEPTNLLTTPTSIITSTGDSVASSITVAAPMETTFSAMSPTTVAIGPNTNDPAEITTKSMLASTMTSENLPSSTLKASQITTVEGEVSTVTESVSTTSANTPEFTSSAAETTTANIQEATTDSQDSTTELTRAVTTIEIDPARLMSTVDPANVIFPAKRLKRPSPNRKEGRTKRHFPITFDDQSYAATVTPIHPPISDFHFVTLESRDDDIECIYQPKTPLIPRKEIHHVFYLNNQDTIQARYKVYNSILRFAYVQNIRSSVLELELDSKDYDLLIMVPDFGFGLDYLMQTLKLAPSLRLIRREMKPRWVQAIVPDFKLKGNIFLTNDLQNMGILEAFEPARADFSPMTNESDIYVKHIEQSINVHLRTRPLEQLKRNVGPFNRPIEVSVNHPFAFFIIDKELDVAIVAGRVLNPLNIRIQ